MVAVNRVHAEPTLCVSYILSMKEREKTKKKYDGRLQEIFAALFADAAVCPPTSSSNHKVEYIRMPQIWTRTHESNDDDVDDFVVFSFIYI